LIQASKRQFYRLSGSFFLLDGRDKPGYDEKENPLAG
jgi:hypothetical protein